MKIAQKTVEYTLLDKLTDGMIAILTGANDLVVINKRVRAASALQAVFGLKGCAEQSMVQETLDASTAQNAAQMHQALKTV